MAGYSYQVVDAPDGQGHTSLNAINDKGEVAGTVTAFYPTTPYSQAFTMTATGYTNLHSGSGAGPFAYALGLNNHGDLAGQSGYAGFERTAADGKYTHMAAGGGGGASTVAFGVNDNGLVVGGYSVSNLMQPGVTDTTLRGALWQHGHMNTLMMPGSVWTVAHGVNDSGTVVGSFGTVAGIDTPFVEQFGQFHAIHIPGAVSADAYGVSNTGEIVGTYTDAEGHDHGWFDLAGQIHTLDIPGAIDTFLYGVNDFGQMVGASTTLPGHVSDGFVVTPDDMPARLPMAVRLETGLTNTTALAFHDPSVPQIALALTS